MHAGWQAASEVLRVPADVLDNVSLFPSSLHPIFVTAHFEEARERVLAGSVPPVDVIVFIFPQRLLDIPEDVIWELGEDLVVRARR